MSTIRFFPLDLQSYAYLYRQVWIALSYFGDKLSVVLDKKYVATVA